MGLIGPVLGLALLASNCETGGDLTGPDNQVSVRVVNAVGGVTGDLAVTANGRVIGTVLGYGAMGAECAPISAGRINLAFGPATADSTAIAGAALSTQSLTFAPGGSFTIVATGTAASAGFVVLNNAAFTGSIGSGQAAVRFVNLVPTLSGGASSFDVFAGTTPPTQQTADDLAFRSASPFSMLTAGATTLEFRDAADNLIFTNAGAELDLQAGSVNVVAILPDSLATGYELINITPCP
jgi:hypothetical protein